MKVAKLWFKTGAVLLLIIAMASCQDDLSTIGAELLGSETPTGILDDSHTVVAYSQQMGPVQSNRLPSYQLGIYNSPVYGKSTVNLLSQLTMRVNNPKFGDSAVVDSVFIYLPYYSTETVADSVPTYELDSIYSRSQMNISIYESQYYLREYDPGTGFEEFQAYYSDQGEAFDGFVGQELGRVESFTPSAQGFVFDLGDDEKENLAPGLRVKLDSIFFQEKIIDMEGSEGLRNNTNFRDYFRGLYFKVDSQNNDGSLFLFDASKAELTVYYSYLPDDSDDRRNEEFKLDLKGVNVNTFENAPLPQHIQSVVENPNREQGEENLFLRGGEGIMTVVDLFGPDVDGDGVPEELEMLRAKEWLINEANLVFYVNQDLMAGGSHEPERISIYDLKNNALLADYFSDPTGGMPAKEALVNHLGKLERGSDEHGEYYKIKITNHVSNLINKDSLNVPLGVVVTQNVNNRAFQKLSLSQEPDVEKVPAGSVISPKGTVLHGNRSFNEEKRLKLQIYYTEPN